jgi:CRP-like cAMP-binding protein
MFMEGNFGELPQRRALKAEFEYRSPPLRRGIEHKKEHASGALLLAEDRSERQKMPRILLSGWASRAKISADGKCQIFGFLIPGDLICGPPRTLGFTPATIVAVTSGVTADIPANNFAPSATHSHFAVIEMAEGETYGLLHRQIMRLGHLNGVQRLADLLLEFQQRLSLAGIGTENGFPMPLTQDLLADALGMSAVHANRCIQQLRQRKIIRCSKGEVTVLDSHYLAALAHGTAEM